MIEQKIWFYQVILEHLQDTVSHPCMCRVVLFSVSFSLTGWTVALRSRSLPSSQVSGVVETTRPDARNAQYAAAIKDGDALLNRVQKLSRVISY